MRVVLISDALRPQLGKRRRLKKPTDDLSAYFFTGGDDGDRTHDLSIANAALSQLSYIPSALLFYDYAFSCQEIKNFHLYLGISRMLSCLIC